MENYKLHPATLDKIKEKPFLLAKMATALNISTAYLLRLIRENDRRLTQKEVVTLILDDLETTEGEIFSGVKSEVTAA